MTSPYLANLAAAALQSGFTINSPSPGVSGTYPIDDGSQLSMLKLMTYVQLAGTFPTGLTAWGIDDIDGITHQIPSVAVFKAMWTAAADYVAQLNMIMDGRSSATALPPNSTTLTI